MSKDLAKNLDETITRMRLLTLWLAAILAVASAIALQAKAVAFALTSPDQGSEDYLRPLKEGPSTFQNVPSASVRHIELGPFPLDTSLSPKLTMTAIAPCDPRNPSAGSFSMVEMEITTNGRWSPSDLRPLVRVVAGFDHRVDVVRLRVREKDAHYVGPYYALTTPIVCKGQKAVEFHIPSELLP